MKLCTTLICLEEECQTLFEIPGYSWNGPTNCTCPGCGSSAFWPLDKWFREHSTITLKDGDIDLVVADPETGTIVISTRTNGLQLIVPILEAAILEAQLGMAITQAVLAEIKKTQREIRGDGD